MSKKTLVAFFAILHSLFSSSDVFSQKKSQTFKLCEKNFKTLIGITGFQKEGKGFQKGILNTEWGLGYSQKSTIQETSRSAL